MHDCRQPHPGNESVLRVLGRARRLAKEFDFSDSSSGGLNEFINELQLVHAEVHEQLVATYFEVPREVA